MTMSSAWNLSMLKSQLIQWCRKMFLDRGMETDAANLLIIILHEALEKLLGHISQLALIASHYKCLHHALDGYGGCCL